MKRSNQCPPIRKRQLCVEAEPTTDSSPPPTTKQRKLENQRRHRTPSSFWNNLSRLWLNPRALREFDRRIAWPAAPIPPDRTGMEDIDLAQLKRFARHGGPGPSHLRVVSSKFSLKALDLSLMKRLVSMGNSERSDGHSEYCKMSPYTQMSVV